MIVVIIRFRVKDSFMLWFIARIKASSMEKSKVRVRAQLRI